jgi:hypothetical protein
VEKIDLLADDALPVLSAFARTADLNGRTVFGPLSGNCGSWRHKCQSSLTSPAHLSPQIITVEASAEIRVVRPFENGSIKPFLTLPTFTPAV